MNGTPAVNNNYVPILSVIDRTIDVSINWSHDDSLPLVESFIQSAAQALEFSYLTYPSIFFPFQKVGLAFGVYNETVTSTF
jgi:hypothetical protein